VVDAFEGRVANGDAAHLLDGDTVDLVDTPGKTDPQARARLDVEHAAKATHHGALPRPDLLHPRQQPANEEQSNQPAPQPPHGQRPPSFAGFMPSPDGKAGKNSLKSVVDQTFFLPSRASSPISRFF